MYCLHSLGRDIAGEKNPIQQVVRRFLGENNYTMKFNILTCRTLKQACHFLELKLFRIKYPPSDICYTVHVIFKVSINTAKPSPITGFRGVKDFFLKVFTVQSYRNTEKSKAKAENSEKGNQILQRRAE